jgi:NAD+ diphosphatase
VKLERGSGSGTLRGAPPPTAWWFVYRQDDLLVRDRDGTGEELIPRSRDLEQAGLGAGEAHFLGTLDGEPAYAVRADSAAQVAGARFEGLRPLYARLGDELFNLAGMAKQVATWDRDHQFCGRCGSPTRTRENERAKLCPSCGHLAFPRLSPAIIVAVTRGASLLMAHADRFPPGLFSVIAGFVEPGETLEECVAREVREETGIEVTSIRYFGSQSWSFPHSLMLALTAEHASGEIAIDGAEVNEAAWFTADAMPRVPDRASIARRLIDWFTAKHGPGRGEDRSGHAGRP